MQMDESKAGIAKRQLEAYARDYKIFIDTCSLLESSASLFWNNIIPLLKKYNNKIIIPLKCIEEIKKHYRSTDDILAKSAGNALIDIQDYIKEGYISVRGENSDNFADNVFHYVFTKFRMQYRLLLITQDRDLSEDILKLNDSRSVKTMNRIHVKKINGFGYLSSIFPKSHEEKGQTHQIFDASQNIVNDDEKFELCSIITDIPDGAMNVTHVPQAGEQVYFYDEGWHSIMLTEKIGSGGEAVTYATNTQYVAKIYHAQKITRRKYEKVSLMLTKNIDCPGICFPLATLHNENKEFVGYLMKRARGKELHRGILLAKQILMKNFPKWRKRDMVELCITILEKIQYLHDRNIILGDINQTNILVVSPKEVYFVDTDSYQIEGFPCPVGWTNFTAPEIQYKTIHKDFTEFLRTKGNEYFAVATLLFMIMLPGKPPYAQQGGGDPSENIIGMDFSYPLGEKSTKKIPDGPWRFMWSHLTYDVKKAFYETFRKGEKHSTEETRITVAEWLSLFRYYLELLDSGMYGQQDPMSEELFPTRYKSSSKNPVVTCKLCRKEVLESQCQNGICWSCLNLSETYRCARCGKELTFTNYQRYIKQSKRYDYCYDCHKWSKEVRTELSCAECGKSFEVTNGEYEFLMSKHYDLPKRCRSCRNNKRHLLI